VSAHDRVIPASSQYFMARRMNARTSEIPASHASLVSQPAAVAAAVAQAARQ
jgi:pimeloyl-ACP methyl ester carboxylesterase